MPEHGADKTPALLTDIRRLEEEECKQEEEEEEECKQHWNSVVQCNICIGVKQLPS